jgi:hypothetical protein
MGFAALFNGLVHKELSSNLDNITTLTCAPELVNKQ